MSKWRIVIDSYEVMDGYTPPKGYGVAYYDVCRRCHVFYPLGINWLVMGWRNLTFLYWRIAWWTPKGQRRFESRLRSIVRGSKQYGRGYLAGLQECEADEQRAFLRGEIAGRRAERLEQEFRKTMDIDYTKGADD